MELLVDESRHSSMLGAEEPRTQVSGESSEDTCSWAEGHQETLAWVACISEGLYEGERKGTDGSGWLQKVRL